MYFSPFRAVRESKGLSVGETAQMMYLSPRTIENIEQGIKRISINILVSYVKAFGCSADFLLGLSRNAYPNQAAAEKKVVKTRIIHEEDPHVYKLLEIVHKLPKNQALALESYAEYLLASVGQMM